MQLHIVFVQLHTVYAIFDPLYAISDSVMFKEMFDSNAMSLSYLPINNLVTIKVSFFEYVAFI